MLSPFLLGGIIINIFLLILSILLIGLGLYLCYKATNIKITKDTEIDNIKKQRLNLIEDINSLTRKRSDLQSAFDLEKLAFNTSIDKMKSCCDEQYELYQQNVRNSMERYSETLERSYSDAEKQYDRKIQQKKDEYDLLTQEQKDRLEDAEGRLKELESLLSAAAEAQLREREKEENLQFYKLSVTPNDLEDIARLNSFKLSLHNPVIVSKLIWTTYFQKQTTEMCNRILGTDKVCGIYKITNLKTQQCYIGQSVDVAQRWKDHCKCGLGIDASSTNKLYKAMQIDGLWSFTFELIEECTRTELDKKEKQWIELYKAKEFGYNISKGNH